MIKKICKAAQRAGRFFDYALVVLTVIGCLFFFVTFLHLMEAFFSTQVFGHKAFRGRGFTAKSANGFDNGSTGGLELTSGNANSSGLAFLMDDDRNASPAEPEAVFAPPEAVLYKEAPPVDAGLPDNRPSFGKEMLPVPLDPMSELLQTPWSHRVAIDTSTDNDTYEAAARSSYNSVGGTAAVTNSFSSDMVGSHTIAAASNSSNCSSALAAVYNFPKWNSTRRSTSYGDDLLAAANDISNPSVTSFDINRSPAALVIPSTCEGSLAAATTNSTNGIDMTITSESNHEDSITTTATNLSSSISCENNNFLKSNCISFNSSSSSTGETDSVEGDGIPTAAGDFNAITKSLEGVSATANDFNSPKSSGSLQVAIQSVEYNGNLSVSHFNSSTDDIVAGISNTVMEDSITTMSAGRLNFSWWILLAASIITSIFNISQ